MTSHPRLPSKAFLIVATLLRVDRDQEGQDPKTGSSTSVEIADAGSVKR